MKKQDLLQTLHNMYDEFEQLHHDINNCIDINCEQITDLIDSNYELEEIVRYMICEIEN
jgi:flagellar hook-associated protein FlgK